MIHEVISWSDAKAKGLRFFFDGTLCKQGHVSPRYVSSRGCKECSFVSAERWKRDNRNKCNAYSKKRRKEHPEKCRAADQRWQQENHHKTAFYARRRRFIKRNNGGSHTLDELADILKMQKGRCAYFWRCGVKFKKGQGEVDHIIPISRGGTDDRRNIQILCYSCNRQKWATDQIEFMQSHGRLL